MQNNEIKYIRASEISSFYLCPRLVYFQRRRDHDITGPAVRAGFFKALSSHLATVLSSPWPEAAMEDAIKHAGADSLVIYGIKYKETVDAAATEARSMMGKMIAGIAKEKEGSGEEELMKILSPSSVSVTAYSHKLRISGTIDKVLMRGDVPVPVIVSASDPPETGVYSSDRVRLAAYSLLLGEKYDIPCSRGAVEYVPGWSLRWAEIRYEDRRKALYARNRAIEMDRGRMPDAKRGKWCGACGHDDACSVKPSLLGALFK